MDNTTTQVKFTIESDIVATFRARCAAEGVSMVSVIRKWMKDGIPNKDARINTSTRPHRKKAVRDLTTLLNCIMDSESEYRDSIPEQFIQRYEAADYACDMLVEAINCLEEAF
jgi:hypothetical protein